MSSNKGLKITSSMWSMKTFPEEWPFSNRFWKKYVSITLHCYYPCPCWLFPSIIPASSICSPPYLFYLLKHGWWSLSVSLFSAFCSCLSGVLSNFLGELFLVACLHPWPPQRSTELHAHTKNTHAHMSLCKKKKKQSERKSCSSSRRSIKACFSWAEWGIRFTPSPPRSFDTQTLGFPWLRPLSFSSSCANYVWVLGVMHAPFYYMRRKAEQIILITWQCVSNDKYFMLCVKVSETWLTLNPSVLQPNPNKS